jgi:hypothetical protein
MTLLILKPICRIHVFEVEKLVTFYTISLFWRVLRSEDIVASVEVKSRAGLSAVLPFLLQGLSVKSGFDNDRRRSERFPIFVFEKKLLGIVYSTPNALGCVPRH